LLTLYSEPEFRLIFMSLTGIFCGIRMFLFSYTMAIVFLFSYIIAIRANAVLYTFLQGVINISVLIRIFLTLSYRLDAF
jgi:hypothetical protein